MLCSLIQETRQSAAKQERPNYTPRSLNHESEREPSKWMYTPSSMSYEGNNRAKRKAPTRTGREHAARETKTTKVNSIRWLHSAASNVGFFSFPRPLACAFSRGSPKKESLLAGYVKTSRVQIAQENIKKGPLSTLPRVVPLLTSLHSQTIPLLNTRCLRTDRKFKYQSNICGLNGLLFNFSANRWMVPNVVKGLPKVHCEKSYMYCFSYCGCHLMQQANCVA